VAGRIRSTKPELVHDERIATRSDTARILYYALLGVVDDEGRAKAQPAYLHGVAFWGQPRSLRRVSDALDELVAHDVLVIYTARGGEWLQIVGFTEKGSLFYQRIEKPQPSTIPAPTLLHSRNAPRLTTEPLRDESSPDLEHEQDQDLEHEREREQGAASRPTPVSPLTLTIPKSPKPRPKRIPADGDQQRVIDAFHQAYRAASGGVKPTWGAKQVAMLKTLIAKHSADEVVRRITILRVAPPSFPPAPVDLASFVQHFDKFAIAGTPRASARNNPTETALETLRTLKEAEAQGNADPFGDMPHPSEGAA